MVNAKFFRIVDGNALSKRSILNLLKLKSLQLTKKDRINFYRLSFFLIFYVFFFAHFFIFTERKKKEQQ